MELTMYERLLQMPIFVGLTIHELSDVLSHVKLDFINYKAGDNIVQQNDPCRNMLFIINGHITSTFRHPTASFMVTESLERTTMIEPYNLFGMEKKFSRDYNFDTNGTTLSIDRTVLLKHMMTNPIVNINLLNLISNRYHSTLRLMNEHPDDSVSDKIKRFFKQYCIEQRGRKELKIKMTDIASCIHETRLNVSKALNEMQRQALIRLDRQVVEIKDLSYL